MKAILGVTVWRDPKVTFKEMKSSRKYNDPRASITVENRVRTEWVLENRRTDDRNAFGVAVCVYGTLSIFSCIHIEGPEASTLPAKYGHDQGKSCVPGRIHSGARR